MRYFRFLIVIVLLSSCQMKKELPTVSQVDINKYSGTWYEFARYPNRFEKGLKCVTANYSILENGKIEVLNQGHPVDEPDKVKSTKGKAWVPNSNTPGQLKVQFFWPFSADYYIIDLDENYQHALVGTPNRKYLWVLSRDKVIATEVYEKLMSIAKEQGFLPEKLMKVEHDCN